jgi:hypothetical protein
MFAALIAGLVLGLFMINDIVVNGNDSRQIAPAATLSIH